MFFYMNQYWIYSVEFRYAQEFIRTLQRVSLRINLRVAEFMGVTPSSVWLGLCLRYFSRDYPFVFESGIHL